MSDVPADENCSRCGRPYREHAHALGEVPSGMTTTHAFRRQPYVNGNGGKRMWSGDHWWPDGRWDASVSLLDALKVSAAPPQRTREE